MIKFLKTLVGQIPSMLISLLFINFCKLKILESLLSSWCQLFMMSLAIRSNRWKRVIWNKVTTSLNLIQIENRLRNFFRKNMDWVSNSCWILECIWKKYLRNWWFLFMKLLRIVMENKVFIFMILRKISFILKFVW